MLQPPASRRRVPSLVPSCLPPPRMLPQPRHPSAHNAHPGIRPVSDISASFPSVVLCLGRLRPEQDEQHLLCQGARCPAQGHQCQRLQPPSRCHQHQAPEVRGWLDRAAVVASGAPGLAAAFEDCLCWVWGAEKGPASGLTRVASHELGPASVGLTKGADSRPWSTCRHMSGAFILRLFTPLMKTIPQVRWYWHG